MRPNYPLPMADLLPEFFHYCATADRHQSRKSMPLNNKSAPSIARNATASLASSSQKGEATIRRERTKAVPVGAGRQAGGRHDQSAEEGGDGEEQTQPPTGAVPVPGPRWQVT